MAKNLQWGFHVPQETHSWIVLWRFPQLCLDSRDKKNHVVISGWRLIWTGSNLRSGIWHVRSANLHEELIMALVPMIMRKQLDKNLLLCSVSVGWIVLVVLSGELFTYNHEPLQIHNQSISYFHSGHPHGHSIHQNSPLKTQCNSQKTPKLGHPTEQGNRETNY